MLYQEYVDVLLVIWIIYDLIRHANTYTDGHNVAQLKF